MKNLKGKCEKRVVEGVLVDRLFFCLRLRAAGS